MTERVLQCVVLTPDRVIFSGPAEFVVVPLEDGELGIAPGRQELVAELAPGELRIRSGGEVARYYIEEAIAEVIRDRVRILGRKILRPEEIDGEAAQAMLDQLLSTRCRSDEELATRDAQILRLRRQLRIYRA
ncbi:MAG: F0F1 ATP synthase subunit epsilon [Thermoguttaceae bacterium]|nr:F0F1 ATP synthase subunit epsilon [Thermoguttaceae bacterium]MDW8079684.1 F0F1 ATP synthase subunit epsilon [Thermoguttaceae bacterium]